MGLGQGYHLALRSISCSSSGHYGCTGGSRVQAPLGVKMGWQRKGLVWSVCLIPLWGLPWFFLHSSDSPIYNGSPSKPWGLLPPQLLSHSATLHRWLRLTTYASHGWRRGSELAHLSWGRRVGNSKPFSKDSPTLGPRCFFSSTPHRISAPSCDSCQHIDFYNHLF